MAKLIFRIIIIMRNISEKIEHRFQNGLLNPPKPMCIISTVRWKKRQIAVCQRDSPGSGSPHPSADTADFLVAFLQRITENCYKDLRSVHQRVAVPSTYGTQPRFCNLQYISRHPCQSPKTPPSSSSSISSFPTRPRLQRIGLLSAMFTLTQAYQSPYSSRGTTCMQDNALFSSIRKSQAKILPVGKRTIPISKVLTGILPI